MNDSADALGRSVAGPGHERWPASRAIGGPAVSRHLTGGLRLKQLRSEVKHASWMNQVEIWFSILHRRIIRYGDFGSTDHQKNEVEAFIRHWNKNEAHPFRWTWRSGHVKNHRQTVTPATDAQVPS